ncbi:MAG TPA: hypothetical protein VNO31_44805 [Umezawaea sp.]|nr:hypothetical protein [Umezawaea sp.]
MHNAGPVTFTVLVGVRRLPLQAKASTCVGIGVAWAELTLSVP